MDKKEINSSEDDSQFSILGLQALAMSRQWPFYIALCVESSLEYTHLTRGPLKPIAAVSDPP
jgi:hypothetical protein